MAYRKFDLKFIYFVLFLILTIIFIIMYFEFNRKIEQMRNNITENEISKVSEYAQNISHTLKKIDDKNLYLKLKNDEVLRKDLEEKISMIKSTKYINIFIVRKDENNKLRYLLDSEQNIENKGEFNQKFDPQNKIWEKVFINTSAEYAIQEGIKDLWITYLYPIKNNNNQILAVIAFDFSITAYIQISNILSPLKQFLFYIVLLMFVILIFTYIQIYFSYKTNLKSYIDPLTLTYNRHYLNKLTSKVNLENYVICMIDVDYFKKINDKYGHQAGDKVLQSFSKRINNKLKKGDILIRYGGEEFLLFLQTKNENIPHIVFERMRKSIEDNPILVDDILINITASFGINLKPKRYSSIFEAIKVADEQLYKAKNTGRNKIVSIN